MSFVPSESTLRYFSSLLVKVFFISSHTQFIKALSYSSFSMKRHCFGELTELPVGAGPALLLMP